DDPLELNRKPLHFVRFNRVGDFAVGTEEPASVSLKPVAKTHQTELDREPKKAGHGPDDALQPFEAPRFVLHIGYHLRGCVSALPKTYQRIGKQRIRMHRNMACDVVKDVRLRQVIKTITSANRDCSREAPIAQAIEKNEAWDISAHC